MKLALARALLCFLVLPLSCATINFSTRVIQAVAPTVP
jgi:hypothetical protein